MNFLAFGWGPHTHDSTGGWDHYVGSGNNREEAVVALFEAIGENEGMSDKIHFGHVVDVVNNKIVYNWSKYNNKL